MIRKLTIFRKLTILLSRVALALVLGGFILWLSGKTLLGFPPMLFEIVGGGILTFLLGLWHPQTSGILTILCLVTLIAIVIDPFIWSLHFRELPTWRDWSISIFGNGIQFLLCLLAYIAGRMLSKSVRLK